MADIALPAAGRPQVLITAAPGETLDALDRDTIVALYKAHGAIQLNGFGAGVEAFHTFARRFCSTSVVNESPGRSLIDERFDVHSVDGGNRAFSLHPELSREPWKPDVAFFGCLTAPSSGGRTTLCDGVELVKAMPPEVRRGLEGRRLLQVKPTWPALLEFWLGTPDPTDAQLANPPAGCPYAFRRIEGVVVRYFSRPALHKPMFASEPAFGNFLLFARFNHDRVGYPLLDDGSVVPDEWLVAIRDAGARLSAEIVWQPGDVAMVDNTRFMHGRTAIVDTAERVIMTYFGYLDFAIPDPEEPANPVWRQRDFTPPRPPHRQD